MKRRNNLSFDLIVLDQAKPQSLHRQLYEQLSTLIQENQLAVGSYLPSTREAADLLDVGRNTISVAYEMLAADGLIFSKQGAGTFVAPRLKAVDAVVHKVASRAKSLPLSDRGTYMGQQPKDGGVPGQIAFHPGYPDTEHFPIATWSRLVRRHARHPNTDLYGYHSTGGFPPLQQALADFLAISRGVDCVPEQIILTTGAQAALDLVARMVLDKGDDFWIEEPTYKGAYSAMTMAEANPHFIPVDRAGWHLEALYEKTNAKALYLTPSCQWPLGQVMRMKKRIQTLEIARQQNFWVIEDDYGSEFRFQKRVEPAIQGIDQDERVIYVGTFSKVMFPALRVGYAIVPKSLCAGFERAVNVTGQYPPLLLQAALAEFIGDGHFAAHLTRMRSLYRKRHDIFIKRAREELSQWMSFFPAEAGMQIVGHFKDEISDVEFAQLAGKNGVTVTPVSPLYQSENGPTGLLFGFAGVDEHSTDAGLVVLRKLLAMGHGKQKLN